MNDRKDLSPETDKQAAADNDGRKLADTPWTDDEAAKKRDENSRFEREVARLMTDRERATSRAQSATYQHKVFRVGH